MTTNHVIEALSRYGVQLLTDPFKRDVQLAKCMLPYCYFKLDGHERNGQVIVLNRNYKPLGHTGREWVDYQLPQWDYCKGRLDRPMGTETWWFFNDGTAPWQSADHLANYLRTIADCLADLLERGSDE